LLASILAASGAMSQVRQAGSVTPGHPTMWATNGVVQDAGPATSGSLTNVGVTATGLPLCINDASQSAPGGYHQLCLGANVNGAGLLSYQAFGAAAQQPLDVNINGANYPLESTGLIAVPTNAALKALTAGSFPLVYRAGFYAAGDRGAAFFEWNANQCTVNPPSGDNGSQVAPNVGIGCWIAQSKSEIDPTQFGALCNGSTSDSAAFSAALASMTTGGILDIPATGAACVLNPGIGPPPANINFKGVALNHWAGYAYLPPPSWAAAGSWIECADTTNPCITISNVGDKFQDVNFISPQPTPPSTGTWTPTPYPYAVLVNGAANFTGFENVSFNNFTDCVDVEGPSNGIAGIATWMQNVWFGCFTRGVRFHQVDNTVSLHNLRFDTYTNLPPVVTYMEANKVDMDIAYLANPQMSDVEFYQSWRPIQLTNATVTSGFGNVTFALANLQGTNISFNEVCQGVVPTSSGVYGVGDLTNVIAARDTTAGSCPTAGAAFFDFSSSNANWAITNLRGAYMQTVADLGPGGNLRLTSADVQQYGAFAAGGVAFGVDSAALLQISGTPFNAIRPSTSPAAGAIIGCSIAYPSSCGTLAPLASGPPGQGYVQLENSAAPYSGQAAFYTPDGSRQGFVGRATASAGMLINSDNGNVAITAGDSSGNGSITLAPSSGGAQGLVTAALTGGHTALTIGAMPTTCSGLATGTLVNNGGVANVCP
jgi:hypothetical protein